MIYARSSKPSESTTTCSQVLTLVDGSPGIVAQEQKGRLLDAPHIQGVVFLVEGHGPLFGVEDSFQSERCGWADGTNPEGFTT